MKILVINGPNLDMLGIREPEIYGKRTLADLEGMIRDAADKMGIETEFFQSNHEGEIVEELHRAYRDRIDGIVINPAAYTHTSVAILDAVKAIGIPTVEVHISDVDSRDEFRKVSYVRQACIGTFSGRGFDGYIDAVEMLAGHIEGKK